MTAADLAEKKMSLGDMGCFRLCRLMDEYLRPHTESLATPLTKEKEKLVLIVLSQVLKEVKLWIQELDCDSDNDVVGKPAFVSECSDGFELHVRDHYCLAKIVGDLVFLLAVESQYIQHSAGNTLVVISDFVAVSEGNWDDFIQLLSLSLEYAITKALSPFLEHLPNKSIDSGFLSSNFSSALKPKLQNANWSSVAGVIRVLRNIVKHLKQGPNYQVLKVYYGFIGLCFSNMTWDWLGKNLSFQDVRLLRSCSKGSCHDMNIGLPEPNVTVKSNLLQLFCSLVEQDGLLEGSCDSLDKHPVISEIRNLIPKFTAWCQKDQMNNISHYIEHKILVLMTRLSCQCNLEYSDSVSWLHFMHQHFQDLLSRPLTQVNYDEDDFLEGSPFFVSVPNVEKYSASSPHLQRLAVFLFLKYSLSLITQKESTGEPIISAIPNSCFKTALNVDLQCVRTQKGLSELFEWLQGHLPTDILVDCDLYFERCVSFALSFLQLYMHEDDILFKVLLQLLSVPFFSQKLASKGREMFQEVKDDRLFLISDVFNPIHLFHLFLAELQYDHQVLLDYLITTDTGANSAEYLLKCLRKVCDSWDLFSNFSVAGIVVKQSSCKKRKSFVADLDSYPERPSVSKKGVGISHLHKEERDVHCRKQLNINRLPFENAKKCLLLLKKSIGNLHLKNLFPYNPQVLLRRLSRFQELCVTQQRILTSEG